MGGALAAGKGGLDPDHTAIEREGNAEVRVAPGTCEDVCVRELLAQGRLQLEVHAC